MPRFLHAADIHLDSPLRGLESYDGAPVEEIRGATRRALRNLVDLALEQSVDLVVIAGDLYDGDWRDHNTGLFFVSQASRLTAAGIPLVMIRGNHDAANQMTRSLPLPKNPDGSSILLSSKSCDSRRFQRLGIAVHGRSFRQRAETENMAADYPAADGGMFNIGLLHTSLTGAEGHEPYAPCTPQQLADKHYDYWALGHVHTRGERQVEGAAPVVFPGNIQGRHVRETGVKGCVIVDVDAAGKTTCAFHPLDVVRWQVCHLDASQVDHGDTLVDLFGRWLTDQVEAAEDRSLVARVRLAGPSPIHAGLMMRHAHWENALRAVALDLGGGRVWLESLRLRTVAPSSGDAAMDVEGPLASLDEVLAELTADGPSVDALIKALEPLNRKLPDDLLSGDEDPLRLSDPQWLAELVSQVRPLLYQRLRFLEEEA